MPKAMEDEMRCAEALEQGCVRLLFIYFCVVGATAVVSRLAFA